MSCSKCNEKFILKNSFGVLFFVSEIEELVKKLELFFNNLSIDCENSNGLLIIKTKDVYKFFHKNLEKFKNYFNELERNTIKIFISDNEKSFTIQSILKAKPLQRFINIFDDQDFFDIVNNESLTAYFQPIIDVKNNQIYGYETLSRGVKEDGSLMYPNILFEKSKRNDYNFKLDRLCRETALKTAATKKIHQKVFINFIPTSIYDPEFCLKSTEKWAKQLEFDPSQIVFEVVETELVKDQRHLKNILEYYRSQNFKIALDDVGEGYSSLNMLIELKPDIIKIDRNIINSINTNHLKQSVYRALFNLSKEHNITVLAEGIETKEEFETIKEIGVDLAQGYYFAKPSSEPIRKI